MSIDICNAVPIFLFEVLGQRASGRVFDFPFTSFSEIVGELTHAAIVSLIGTGTGKECPNQNAVMSHYGREMVYIGHCDASVAGQILGSSRIGAGRPAVGAVRFTGGGFVSAAHEASWTSSRWWQIRKDVRR